jgi:DNA-binding response OmpR family regulator
MGKKRVLFVDNRPEQIRQPLVRLQVAGYEVEGASSGAEGLRKLRSHPFDAIILDAELPNEDGWGVLKEVRADPKLERVKAIVLMAPEGETGKLALVSVDAELRRPFNMGELLAALERVVGAP